MARWEKSFYTYGPLSSHYRVEYPAHYVPPVLDLFAEDRAPFHVSSQRSCPKASEHLERAFELLRYKYLSKKLGVPSVANQYALVVRPLRILGNTSSPSAGFLSVSNLLDASFTQGGPQLPNSGSRGAIGEKHGTYLVRRR
jgi:hypothetical protein